MQYPSLAIGFRVELNSILPHWTCFSNSMHPRNPGEPIQKIHLHFCHGSAQYLLKMNSCRQPGYRSGKRVYECLGYRLVSVSALVCLDFFVPFDSSDRSSRSHCVASPPGLVRPYFVICTVKLTVLSRGTPLAPAARSIQPSVSWVVHSSINKRIAQRL